MSSLSLRLLKAFFSLFIGGAVIGLLHQYDTLVAAILILATVLIVWTTYQRNVSNHRAIILISGCLLTGFLGMMGEILGISNGHWLYHDLPDSRSFARWTPFAWMLSFVFLYRIEEFCINHFNFSSLKEKLLLVAVLSSVLPTWGEMVVINFGAWSYTWDYQLLGVPLLAIVFLMIFHVSVYMGFTMVCRKYQINDLVFGCVSNAKTAHISG